MNQLVSIAVGLAPLVSLAMAAHTEEKKTVASDFDRLVRQLGSASFREREEATRRLSAGGEESLGPLRKARSGATDPEQRWRLDRIIRAVDGRLYGLQVAFVGHTREVCAVALSPDGKLVLTGGWEGQMCLWDTATGEELRRLQSPVTAKAVAFSPDGRLAVAAGDGSGGDVRIWDVATGRPRWSLKGHAGPVYGLDYSRDGKSLVTGGFDGTVRVWEVETGKEYRRMNCGRVRLWGVAFAPDGGRVVSGGDDGLVWLWDVASGKALEKLEGHRRWVLGVAYAPDGEHIASCAEGGEILLWPSHEGRAPRRLAGHAGDVLCVHFSPDGRRLLSAGLDGTVRLWDVGTGEEIRRFHGHTNYVNKAYFSEDGRRAVSCSHDRTAALWNLPR